MLIKLIAIGVLFSLLLYLFNARSMKEAALKMMLSGETKVDKSENELKAIRKRIRMDTTGMIVLSIGIIGVGVWAIPAYIKLIFE